ncbi:hypothetical protein L596_019526 [Steinernema carpocapsae]|uniref:Uncharacterized protein n=1 Tax=Steinernema carpocapsae TaxID=34508 RepID=A0A4U5MQU8_STECR|nr:hypothetical protein L596_019526 [Steinernema carpocapsae]
MDTLPSEFVDNVQIWTLIKQDLPDSAPLAKRDKPRSHCICVLHLLVQLIAYTHWNLSMVLMINQSTWDAYKLEDF